jgi:hypothetical protein
MQGAWMGCFQGYRGEAIQDLGYELPRIRIPRTPVNKLGIRPRFIVNSSPSASMGARSNPAGVVRVKEVALLRRLLTTVLTVAVVTMMIVLAMAMALFADDTKER